MFMVQRRLGSGILVSVLAFVRQTKQLANLLSCQLVDILCNTFCVCLVMEEESTLQIKGLLLLNQKGIDTFCANGL